MKMALVSSATTRMIASVNAFKHAPMRAGCFCLHRQRRVKQQHPSARPWFEGPVVGDGHIHEPVGSRRSLV
jgi:hypothetical protein